MNIKLTIKSDAITPDLRRLRKVEDPTVAFANAERGVEGLAVRAFTDDSVRPTAWAPLAATTLARFPRVIAANKKFIRVGSDQLAETNVLAAMRPLGAHFLGFSCGVLF